MGKRDEDRVAEMTLGLSKKRPGTYRDDRIAEMTPGIPSKTPGASQREIYLHRLEPEDIEIIVSRFLARRARCRSCERPGCTSTLSCSQTD